MSERGRRSDAGFTLMEVLVVVVILGLMLGITAAYMPRPHTILELTDATSRIAGAMRLARARAIAASRPVIFAVAPGGHGFLEGDRLIALSPSIALSASAPIRFAPDGSASSATWQVSLDGQARLIRMDWLTGRPTCSSP